MKKRRRKKLIAVLTAMVILLTSLSAYLGIRVLTLTKRLQEAEKTIQEAAASPGGDGEPVLLMTEEEMQEKENADPAPEASAPEDGKNAEQTEGSGIKKEEAAQETAAQKKDAEEPAAEEAGTEEALRKEADSRARAILESMTTEQKVGQLFFVTPEALTGAGQVTRAGDATREAVRKYAVGGLVYFSHNLIDPEQTKAMLSGTKNIYAELGLPEPFLAADEEGGTVVRLADNSAFDAENVGDMIEIGNSGGPARAEEAGHTIGAYMAEAGFNMDFAPVADVLTNPSNTVVAKRVFGSDPQLVKACVTAESDALLSEGVLAVWKHFPGHGSTEADTHKGYAYTDKTLEELLAEDLVPYEDAGEHAPCIMAAHISLPAVDDSGLPSSLSERIITGLLREQLGYDGVVITDALEMGAVANTFSSSEAAVKAVRAGCDMLLMPYSFSSAYEGVLAAVESGEIPEERIDESVMRILRCKIRMQEIRQHD